MLRRIREQVEDYGSALGVYYALCVVASDNQSESFQATHKWLSQLSGFSERTVRNRLPDLVRIKAINVATPKLKAPSTFHLLAFGNGYRASGNGCRAFGNREAPPLPPSEERKNQNSPSPFQCLPKSVSLPTAERIALENRLKALQAKEKRLAGDLSDRVQKETRPDDVARLKRYREEISNLERELGYDID